jgi:tetratricopeptide (TPR) repeat protein
MILRTTLMSGQVLAARYELVRALATGHDQATWLARDLPAATDVVLRVRSASEAGAPGPTVHHPAVQAPQAMLRDGDMAFDVFDYLPGGEIGRLRGRPWPLVVRRLLPVIDALQALHAAGWTHGDLKSANVLLDAEGLARLIDLGSARRLGELQPAGASPYSTSPERLDAAPAAIADDVYALGVLLYELLSGHPPFYPDIDEQRVRTEVPPPVSGRPPPPDALRALVGQCLAKRPADRPASMAAVHNSLAAILAAAPAEDPAEMPAGSDKPRQPRPPVEALPVQPQWRRGGSQVPSASALRKEGFRRGLLVGAMALLLLAAGFTFVVLPDLVASRAGRTPALANAPAPAPVAPPAPAVADLERLAGLKRQAEERRAPLAGVLQRLQQRDVASWGGTDFARAQAELIAGDAVMADRRYEEAVTRFESAAATLAALEQRLPVVVSERLAAAQVAFAAGRAEEAQRQFTAVLAAAPDNAAARAGLARARVLDDVLRATAAGAAAEQAGQSDVALAAYQRALQLDPATAVARAGIERLNSRASSDAYSAALSQAMAALARRDYPAAEAAFERANRIRPGTAEVTEGLQQLRRGAETRSLTATLERAVAAERTEAWSEALGLYREALKVEPALRAAQDGIERVEPRAMLDAELQTFLDRPERLYSPSGRDVARNVLERAARQPAPGSRLQAQQSRLAELLRQAETPIRVALASDSATDVQIYRVGKLGLFERREVELMPGRYTVVGTRQGYRDVRKELNLLPGAAAPVLVVRCEEPI